jgi:hypothetical protein
LLLWLLLLLLLLLLLARMVEVVWSVDVGGRILTRTS